MGKERMGTSMSLVGCLRVGVVRLCGKYINDGETMSRPQGVERPRLIEDRGGRRLSRSERQDRLWGVTDMMPECNAAVSKSYSWHIIEHLFILDVFLDGDGIIQQDDCPFHDSRIVLRYSYLKSMIVNSH